ncbi:MAG: N-acetyltransferase [Prevotella sp.]|nr:N-acetyltransferase [Prevotella sp.]
MSQIEIRRVTNLRELKNFVQFNYDLYRSCQQAVPFLYSEEMNTLRRDRNAAFECCEADYFIAYEDGRAVGRVAAIINRRANERWGRQQVRFGWLDFVDSPAVSRALLETVEQWGRERGMTEIAGPLGFTDMDREGLLIEGFDEQATMYVNYNYPYYVDHLEQMGGWEKDNDYMEYRVKVPERVPDKFHKIAEMVGKRYNLHVHKFTRQELIDGGKGREVFDIINATYKDLYGYSQLSQKQIDQLVDQYIKIADLNLVTSIEDWNTPEHRMIGFGITFPSFTNALRHTRDGRMLPFGWWHLLRALKWHKTDTVDLLLIGVLPEYRAKGANSLIFDDLIQQFQRYGFKWAEAMPQMESNEGVRSQWQYLEATQHRKHRCYRKLL